MEIHLCIPNKDLAKPHSKISTIIMFWLELWYFVEKYITSYSYSAVSKGNNILPKYNEITVVILWSIFIFQIRTTEKESLELVISCLKTYIWNLEFRGLAYSFWDHVIQISFEDVYSQLWTVKLFLEKFTTQNQILIFQEHYVCPICIFIQYMMLWYKIREVSWYLFLHLRMQYE